jgi:hypothetical protein
MRTIFLAAIVGSATIHVEPGLAKEYPGVGVCQGDAVLSIIASGPYKGRAFDLKKIARFETDYANIIGAPQHWSAQLSGPGEENRRYVGSEGALIVFFSCEIHNCAASSLYGVINEHTGAVGAIVAENARVTERGTLTAGARAAIACARAQDEQALKRVEESLKTGPK